MLTSDNVSSIICTHKDRGNYKPKKNKKGNRFFTKKDIDNFHLIYHLVKEKGMTLNGAKKKLKENREDTVENFEIINSLNTIKKLLLDIKENL